MRVKVSRPSYIIDTNAGYWSKGTLDIDCNSHLENEGRDSDHLHRLGERA